ncbi:MAG: hypothetical protein IPM99_19845 [Rubrivivax sp.]|nr:hypothetical protein [Rubrivivax sp.]
MITRERSVICPLGSVTGSITVWLNSVKGCDGLSSHCTWLPGQVLRWMSSTGARPGGRPLMDTLIGTAWAPKAAAAAASASRLRRGRQAGMRGVVFMGQDPGRG